jgi:hypothetical protein
VNVEFLKMALETPRLISPTSAWVEHVPFGFLVIEMTQPGTVVELGAYRGDSYCTFCQAVEMLGLKTRCTAIDTWGGDKHSGQFGTELLEELRAHHDPRYSGFSRLLRATFDEAAGEFAAGSIDLLHIDGLHTYEAVKHDFENWLPKMSRRGVVMFHDTAERREDFGVYKLWAEVAPKYPSFEFVHGHGLGVAAVGAEVPAGLGAFFEWGRSDPALVRKVFETLGDRMQQYRQLLLRKPRVRWWKKLAGGWKK